MVGWRFPPSGPPGFPVWSICKFISPLLILAPVCTIEALPLLILAAVCTIETLQVGAPSTWAGSSTRDKVSPVLMVSTCLWKVVASKPGTIRVAPSGTMGYRDMAELIRNSLALEEHLVHDGLVNLIVGRLSIFYLVQMIAISGVGTGTADIAEQGLHGSNGVEGTIWVKFIRGSKAVLMCRSVVVPGGPLFEWEASRRSLSWNVVKHRVHDVITLTCWRRRVWRCPININSIMVGMEHVVIRCAVCWWQESFPPALIIV